MSEHAVTVLISRRVKPGCEQDFERVCATLMQVAAGFPGHLGAQLMHPGDDPEVQDLLYHVVLAFDSQAHLDAWHHSPERQLGLAATAAYIEGQPRVQALSGLGLWFRTTPEGPPRWKVAVVTWLGICPTVYLLFWATGDWMKNWNLLPRTVVLTLAVVALMTWVVAPRLTQWLKPWLFSRRPAATGRRQQAARRPDPSDR